MKNCNKVKLVSKTKGPLISLIYLNFWAFNKFDKVLD